MNIFKIKNHVLTALLFVCLVAFLGCGNNNSDEVEYDTFRDLSEEMEMQIKQDYWSAFIKPNFPEDLVDVWIEKFYGVYGTKATDIVGKKQDFGVAKVAVIMGSSYDESNNKEFKINDVLFKFEDKNEILIWRKGEFHTLQEAFNQKMVDMSDIFQIASYHNGLSMEVANEIKEFEFKRFLDYLEFNGWVSPWSDPAILEAVMKDGADWLEIYGYYGTYNGYTIVTVWGSEVDTYYLPMTIADIQFLPVSRLPESGILSAWKDGQLYYLQNVYYTNGTYPGEPSGLLTEDDIRSIYNYHRYYYFSSRYELWEQWHGGSK